MGAAKAKSILNGVIGDYLDASQNELTTQMNFYKNEKPLDFSSLCLIENDHHQTYRHQTPQRLTSRICVLVHGLTDDESAWAFKCDEDEFLGDYGSFLQRDLDVTPFYLRYNSGLHVSINGRELNTLMGFLLGSYPLDTSEIVFLCHSMGGLVTRSALHYGANENSPWVKKVKTIVFIGTPHQGSPWEKLGNVATNALGSIPRPYMKLSEKVGNLRSAGIKDLRYGYVLDEDWQDEGNLDSFLENTKKRTYLPDHISYYNATGTVTKDPKHPLALCFGDAMVRKSSSEGRSDNANHHLDFSSESFAEFPGVGHCQLAKNPSVYKQIKAWVGEGCNLQASDIGSAMGDESKYGHFTSHHKNSITNLNIIHEANYRQCVCSEQNGKWAQCKGVASLINDAVGKGATSVEDVHIALTDEGFDLLSKITPISPLVKGVQCVHNGAVGSIYGVIRSCSTIVSEVAKHMCDQMNRREQHNLQV